MKKVVLFICFLCLFACDQSPKNIDKDNPDFGTTHDSQMFFENVRQIYYDREEVAAGKLKVYRFKKRSKATNKPIINLALVNNKRFDEAYILVELNSAFKGRTFEILWEDKNANKKGTYQYTLGNKKLQFKFASQLYESLEKGHQLFYKDKNKNIPIFNNSQERSAFLVTLKDYYKLIGLSW